MTDEPKDIFDNTLQKTYARPLIQSYTALFTFFFFITPTHVHELLYLSSNRIHTGFIQVTSGDVAHPIVWSNI